MSEKKLRFIGVDSWGRPVYKDGTGVFWKDVNLGRGEPYLHRSSPSDDFEGEPDFPIKGGYVLVEQYKENPHRFDYMMLSRLKNDCETYFLGISNRAKTIDMLCVIAEMKKLWNKLPDDGKPEWLAWEQILEYEAMYLSENNN